MTGLALGSAFIASALATALLFAMEFERKRAARLQRDFERHGGLS